MDFLGLETGAFSQLTRQYMQENFNPKTPDVDGIRFVISEQLSRTSHQLLRYYSYGATVEPALWSMFRLSHRIIESIEGPNDGLVSVQSSQWGTYKGTLVDVSHLDLINWSNRLKWMFWELLGKKRK